MTSCNTTGARLGSDTIDELALLRSIVEGSNDAIFAKDLQGRYLLCNARACRGKPAADILGRDDRALFPPQKAAELMGRHAQVIAANRSLSYDHVIDTPEGRLAFTTTASPLHDSVGRVVGTFGISHDITEREKTREALGQSEAFGVAILDSVDAMYAVLDGQGVITRVNQAWRDFAFDNGAEPGTTPQRTGVGTSYLGVCSTSEESSDDTDAVRARKGILGVLDGSLPRFGMAYPCHSPTERRWFSMNVTRLTAVGGGAVVTHTNITRRMEAEIALNASQSLLDKTGRIAGVGGWTHDLTSGVVDWTDETCRIHERPAGHRPTLAEVIGYHAPAARPIVQEAMQRILATGESIDLEVPLITAAGREIWVHAVAELERSDGKPVRLVGAVQDISARRAMESELRRNNELLSSVLESLPCGICAFGADLVVQAHNREFRRLLRAPDALFEGRETRFDDLVRHGVTRGDFGPGDVDDTVQAVIERVRSAIGRRIEFVGVGGKHLEVRIGPMGGGGMVAIYTDISSRREAEASAKRSEQLLRASIDAVDEAFALYDPNDLLVFCNDKYRGLFGPASHLVVPGMSYGSLAHEAAELGTNPTDISEGDAWVAEQAAAQRRGHSARVMRLEDGRVIRTLERRLPEGHRVGFRADITALVRATEEAQAASKAKSRFLANMSHEIRTPMNAILGMLTLLGKTGLTARQADYAGKTAGAARSLLGLLNEILDFSKVEAGAMTLEPRPFSTAALLRDVSVILDANIGSKPVLLRIEIDPALPPLLVGDAMRLQQVLVNLGGNAIKFTPAGKVLLSLARVERADAAVVLEVAVQDQGIGIAPENQLHIFNGFSQAESSTTRRFGGTGLGLAISQRLVTLMGGTLKLESALGQGSRFHFRISLPVASELAEGRAGERSLALPGGLRLTGLRVLVAEDNANNQQVARELLEDEGAKVWIAENGEEAVSAVAAADPPFDVVLMDLQMPVMDGLMATRRIRGGLGRVNLPIVAMTANAMASDRDECLAAGMTDHVGKPFDIDRLVEVLRRYTGRSEAAAGSAAPAAPLAASIVEAAATAGVDIEQALVRLGGRRETYERALRGVVDDLADLPQRLRACIADGDATAASHLLHALKGLAGTLGASRLAEETARAERLLGQVGAADAATAAVQRTCAAIAVAGPELTALLRALQQVREQNEANSSAGWQAGDAVLLQTALERLGPQLRRADMAATETMDDVQRRFGNQLGEHLRPLAEAVDLLDFERAIGLCEEVVATLRSAREPVPVTTTG